MPEVTNNHLLPAATYESWRTWLMTGAQRGPIDRRRLRGAHRGLKKMLLEGAGDPKRPHSWKEFSDAMVRHAVDEAMRALPPDDTRVVKLAFFGGYSNREIALQVGVAEATVQRRLREALDKISAYVQRGRSMGRRAFYALLIWLSGRTLNDAVHHTVQAAAVAAAATIVIAAPSSPASASAPPITHDRIVQVTAGQPATAPPAPTDTAPPTAAPGAIPAANLQPPSGAGPVITVPSLPPLPPVTLPPLPNPPPVKVPGV